MDINRALELEEAKLYRQLEDGMIDDREYRQSLKALEEEAREAIREEAQRAYDSVMNR